MLFTAPNQLGVACNARILATIAGHIAPALGWTPRTPRPSRDRALTGP